MVYQPEEDSYFLSEQLAKYLKKIKNREIRILDLGTGTAIQAQVSRRLGFKNILCSDINPEAIKIAKRKGFKTVQSDLFEKIKGKFDLIIFNPPYLPKNKYDKEKDTTGGEKGDEIIIKFLKKVKNHLNKNGKVFLLISSYTPRKRILKEIKNQKLKHQKLAEKKLFFEKLEVISFS